MAVASSYNYENFRRAKKDMLNRTHEQHAEEVKQISKSIHVLKPYTLCFGTLIPLTEVEAVTLKINIVWK